MEDFKQEGPAGSNPGRLTAENLASLGNQERSELEEMKRKYAIHNYAEA